MTLTTEAARPAREKRPPSLLGALRRALTPGTALILLANLPVLAVGLVDIRFFRDFLQGLLVRLGVAFLAAGGFLFAAPAVWAAVKKGLVRPETPSRPPAPPPSGRLSWWSFVPDWIRLLLPGALLLLAAGAIKAYAWLVDLAGLDIYRTTLKPMVNTFGWTVLGAGLAIFAFFWLRETVGRLLRSRNRTRCWFILLGALISIFIVLRMLLAPVQATGYGFVDFETAGACRQTAILSTSWAERMDFVWAALLLDYVFLFGYIVFLWFTWAWIREGAEALTGSRWAPALTGIMIVLAYLAGAIDFIENTSMAGLLLQLAPDSIRDTAAAASRIKWILPALVILFIPAGGLWVRSKKKKEMAARKTQALLTIQARLDGADPDRLFLGPLAGGMSSAPGDGPQVKLWGRALKAGMLYAWVGKETGLDDAHEPAGQSMLREKNGFAGIVPVSGLEANQKYHYTLTLSPEPPGGPGRVFPSFTTFPEDGMFETFRFTFGSCFRPEFPPQDFSGDVPIFNAIRRGIETDELRFGLLIGDQIYADAIGHNGMDKIPETVEAYRRVYAHSWRHSSLRRLLSELPVFMVLDDHEVDDDWRWTKIEKQVAKIPIWVRLVRWLKRVKPRDLKVERARAALQAYYEHQLMHAPDLPHYPGSDPDKPPSLLPTGGPDDPGGACYHFSYGQAAFFVLDVRTRRIYRWLGQKRILDERQWAALEKWLLEDPHPVKFIVTSSGLLMRYWYDLIFDRWGAYKKERARMVNFIAEHELENVHILSGDVHAANAVTAELKCPGGKTIKLREFCVSPFQQHKEWFKKFGFDRRPFGRARRITFRRRAYLDPNFGVVKVSFQDGKPEVSFEIRDEDGRPVS